MKSAHVMMTKLKENDEQRKKDVAARCAQAKERIDTLRQAVVDREKTIEELRNLRVCFCSSF